MIVIKIKKCKEYILRAKNKLKLHYVKNSYFDEFVPK